MDNLIKKETSGSTQKSNIQPIWVLQRQNRENIQRTENYKFEPNGTSRTEKWKVSTEWVNLISRFGAAKEKIKLDMGQNKMSRLKQKERERQSM